MSSISNIPTPYYQSLFDTNVQNTSKGNNQASSISAASTSDTNQLSPLAQLANTLQQLQQSDPTKYQQVTQGIATKLQAAADTATKNGNTSQASELSQLANEFTTASQNGQMPNLQDIAKTVSGGHHGHHGHGGAQQLLTAVQSNDSQQSSTNPLEIMKATLASAGAASDSTT